LSWYRGGLPDFGTSQSAVQWRIARSRWSGQWGRENGLRWTVQDFGGCSGSLAELFRSRGSSSLAGAVPGGVSTTSRGGAGLVVKTSTASGEDPETIWRRSECDLRDPANPKDSLRGFWLREPPFWCFEIVLTCVAFHRN
jgi:hypothetical protein